MRKQILFVPDCESSQEVELVIRENGDRIAIDETTVFPDNGMKRELEELLSEDVGRAFEDNEFVFDRIKLLARRTNACPFCNLGYNGKELDIKRI